MVCITTSPPKARISSLASKRLPFFPSPDKTLVLKSNWVVYYKYGYISDYHLEIKHSMDEGKLFDDSLDLIFQNLQVLPLNPGQLCDLKKL